jgi:hypothetical protein
MPIEKQKPTNQPEPQSGKPKMPKSSDLSDDDLETISGGVSSTGGTGVGVVTVCVSQT